MTFKIKTLARYTMPLFVAATLAACGDSGSKATPTPPVDGVVKAQDNEAVIYVKTDAAERMDMTLHV